ncbi:MAG: hypothetical protein Q8Q01_05300 [archaeon]|nr:hypothetical protein [archaeon]
MERKITKNKHQYKLSLPIDIVRNLDWDENTKVRCLEVATAMGKGILLVDKKSILKLEIKDE